VRGIRGSVLRFDGATTAQNDFFYTFNARVMRRLLARRCGPAGWKFL
jgi:hypothetical protein